MRERVRLLQEESMAAQPSISAERALLVTQFYKENAGKHGPAVLRGLCFRHICQQRSLYIGPRELIVGERGPAPKACPTYPELTCHSLDDLQALADREKTSYQVPAEVVDAYRREVIPYWRGRSLRDRIFKELSPSWMQAYSAGVFTEFMEQRAPGHTAADDKPFRLGLDVLRAEIAKRVAGLDWESDPLAPRRYDQLRGLDIAAEAAVLLARRHADMAESLARGECDPACQQELQRIAEVCRRVPAGQPRDFREALQAYWFHHLAVITELNGWDAFSPGHLDQHLEPFYERDLAAGRLSREDAKELLACLWIKFNNQPAPPKVGVTAAESGTYNDFVNINLGGLWADGTDGSGVVSELILEVAEEMQLLQPQLNVQLARRTPDNLLQAACRVVRKGYGFPALFNVDLVVGELLRQGKSLDDARQGGISGCVESGAFGKEAYILSGYLNLVKPLELALFNGVDPRSGARCGPQTGDPLQFSSFEELMAAWEGQLRHALDIKIYGNALVQDLFASEMPAPYLSLLIENCIAKGLDYNSGGARYNTTYIQGVGIGTLTDSLSALKEHVFRRGTVEMKEVLNSLREDFSGREPLRQVLVNKTPRYGNDDDRADQLMEQAFDAFFHLVDGRPAPRGGTYRINMLPTTSHIHFGALTGSTPDGRLAGSPLSEGISPVQGADRQGPTAVMQSAAKMDHARTGGTLLNMKFAPEALAGEEGLRRLAALVRGYFALGGHHVQFNVVGAELLREAQACPEEHRGLLVRVAGYSDFFCDLGRELQEEIISRTEHGAG
ncbi:MAG: glycyl radical protein [Candidatus Bipolaricaulota bacterium]